MNKSLENMSHKELTELLVTLLRQGAIFGDDMLIDRVLDEVLVMRRANLELKG